MSAGSDPAAVPGVVASAALVRSGEATPRELVERCLDAIERLDPALNAFRIVLAERALAEAEAGLADGPLRGVPIAIKDDTDVAGEVTTLGTAAARSPAKEDAPIVRRLREAGAIVIGKTNLPELALWGTFTESATFGRTANPCDPTRSPGGSSGGSAAAVAAGMVPAATGTDGGASIRVPAALTGIVGLKPQAGRLGPPRWRGLLQDGFLTRDVADAAALLEAIAIGGGAAAAGGEATAMGGGAAAGGGAAPLDPARPLRVAFSTRPGAPWARIGADSRAAVERVAALLAGLGHDVVERDPDYASVGPLAVPRMLRAVAEEHRDLDWDRLEPRTRRLLRIGRLVPWAPGRTGRAGRLFDEVDLLVSPVTSGTAPPLGQYDGRGAIRTYLGTTSFFSTLPAWNLTGQPAASVPAGTAADGLPIGVQLVARPHDEATLLAVAARIEAAR